MGSIYWAAVGPNDEWRSRYSDLVDKYPDGAFIVRSGDLGFAVIVFTSIALLTLTLLVCRRKFLGAELGGNKKLANASSLCLFSFWLVYVGLCSWNGMKNKKE